MSLNLPKQLVGISNTSNTITSYGKVDVQHFISEMIHKPNALRFWVIVDISSVSSMSHIGWKSKC